MEQKTSRLYPSAPLGTIDLDERLEKNRMMYIALIFQLTTLKQ